MRAVGWKGPLSIACALALAACTTPSSAPGPKLPYSPRASETPHGRPTRTAGGSTTHAPPFTQGPPRTPTQEPSSVSYADGGFVGGMARAYLRSEPATRLEIEIDTVRGREFPTAAEQHALGILERDLDKPDGIVFMLDDELAPSGSMPGGGGDDRYTFKELHKIAAAARDASSAGSIARLHLLIIDGESDEVSSAIGVAINASTAVLFADRIEDAAAPLVGANAIWRSVTVHEFGHLLGLVEIIEDSRTDRHADPQQRGHSPNRDSVMYWAIEDVGIAAILGEGPPTDFDADDRADLEALKD